MHILYTQTYKLSLPPFYYRVKIYRKGPSQKEFLFRKSNLVHSYVYMEYNMSDYKQIWYEHLLSFYIK